MFRCLQSLPTARPSGTVQSRCQHRATWPRALKDQLALSEAISRGRHERVFASFVGSLISDAESEKRTCIVPWDRDNRLLRNEILARGLGVFELRAIGQSLRRWYVKKICTARHMCGEAGATQRRDKFFQ